MDFWGLVRVNMACLTVRMGPHARIANNELYKCTRCPLAPALLVRCMHGLFDVCMACSMSARVPMACSMSARVPMACSMSARVHMACSISAWLVQCLPESA